MTWTEVKQLIRASGLKHSILNKGGAYEMVHVEKPNGPFIIDTHLYAYEPQNWEDRLQRVGIAVPNQLELFGAPEQRTTNPETRP